MDIFRFQSPSQRMRLWTVGCVIGCVLSYFSRWPLDSDQMWSYQRSPESEIDQIKDSDSEGILDWFYFAELP